MTIAAERAVLAAVVTKDCGGRAVVAGCPSTIRPYSNGIAAGLAAVLMSAKTGLPAAIDGVEQEGEIGRGNRGHVRFARLSTAAEVIFRSMSRTPPYWGQTRMPKPKTARLGNYSIWIAALHMCAPTLRNRSAARCRSRSNA